MDSFRDRGGERRGGQLLGKKGRRDDGDAEEEALSQSELPPMIQSDTLLSSRQKGEPQRGTGSSQGHLVQTPRSSWVALLNQTFCFLDMCWPISTKCGNRVLETSQVHLKFLRLFEFGF